MAKSAKPRSVPVAMQAKYDAVVALTDAVCRDHLDKEYRDLARDMTAALCRKRPSPLCSGQPRTWACGIVYLLGQLNFLTDRSFPPYLATSDLCAAFGVGQSTAYAKARVISDMLRADWLNPTWIVPSLLAQHPLTMVAELAGWLVPLGDIEGTAQEIAAVQGLLPYMPAK